MNVIWKFDITSGLVATMPESAHILSVQEQNNRVCIWAMCDPSAPKEVRRFIAYTTGDRVMLPPQRHIGTVQKSNGDVWHVYEKF